MRYKQHDVQKVVEALLKELGGTYEAVKKATGLTAGPIKKLRHGDTGSPLSAEHVLMAAKEHLSKEQLDHCRVVGPPLYDLTLNYRENMARGLQYRKEELPKAHELPKCPVQLWGRTLDSCFGISASALTGNSRCVELMARAGADVITLKTVRTDETFAHNLSRNIGYVTSASLLQPFDPDSFPEMVHADDDWQSLVSGAHFLLVNCFGMPSEHPDEWVQDVPRTVKRLPPGKLLVLSVVGTARKGETDESGVQLIEDFARCVEYAVNIDDGAPHAIEMNWSCPHTYGAEKTVFTKPKLAGDIARRAREIVDASGRDIRLLAKIGPLEPDAIHALCESTAPNLDGYTAINTKPTHVLRTPKDGRERPYFSEDFEKAGVSGIAIQKCALLTIEGLRDSLDRLGFSNHCVFGMGGVTEPEDVRRFLDAGADVVQATTAFWHNIGFAAEVRQFLAREAAGQREQASEEPSEPAMEFPSGFLTFVKRAAISAIKRGELPPPKNTDGWPKAIVEALAELSPDDRDESLPSSDYILKLVRQYGVKGRELATVRKELLPNFMKALKGLSSGDLIEAKRRLQAVALDRPLEAARNARDIKKMFLQIQQGLDRGDA